MLHITLLETQSDSLKVFSLEGGRVTRWVWAALLWDQISVNKILSLLVDIHKSVQSLKSQINLLVKFVRMFKKKGKKMMYLGTVLWFDSALLLSNKVQVYRRCQNLSL